MSNIIKLAKNVSIEIILNTHASSGYCIDIDGVSARFIFVEFLPNQGIGGSKSKYRIEAVKEGITNLTCVRPWDKSDIAWNIEIIVEP